MLCDSQAEYHKKNQKKSEWNLIVKVSDSENSVSALEDG